MAELGGISVGHSSFARASRVAAESPAVTTSRAVTVTGFPDLASSAKGRPALAAASAGAGTPYLSASAFRVAIPVSGGGCSIATAAA